MTLRIGSWIVTIAFAVVVKILFVDRYYPTPPGNMLIWIPIAIGYIVVAVMLIIGWTLLTGRRPRD